MSQEELRILYEDQEILVCVKPPGVPVQSDRTGAYDLASRLLNYLAVSAAGTSLPKARPSGKQQIPYLGIVHRLDRPVGGVMVFAKTKQAAAELSRQVREREMEKRYYCVLTGWKADRSEKIDSQSEGIGQRQQMEGQSQTVQSLMENQIWVTITDYLITDKRTNLSRRAVEAEAGAKEASLRFRLLEQVKAQEESQEGSLTLAEVELLTGRHHQIRVQMTGISEGIWGDTKYNSGFQGKKGWFALALFSCHLAFLHPATGQRLQFDVWPEGEPFDRFGYIQRLRER